MDRAPSVQVAAKTSLTASRGVSVVGSMRVTMVSFVVRKQLREGLLEFGMVLTFNDCRYRFLCRVAPSLNGVRGGHVHSVDPTIHVGCTPTITAATQHSAVNHQPAA